MRTKVLLLIFLLLTLVATVTNRDQIQRTIARITSRGIRNNNPGNIRRTPINWKGEVPDDLKTDNDFEQFIAPLFGIRAMVRDLRTGARRGEDTIREIISQWAPPNENDTEAYIRSVSRRTGIDPDAMINFEAAMPDLLDAIIVHENGSNPYADQLLFEAIAAA